MNSYLSSENRKKIGDLLTQHLADAYTLFVKTINYHWNVTGPHFHSLHELFEDQYKAMIDSNDELAERIRALDQFVPATQAEFLKRTTLKELVAPLSAEKMIQDLKECHESLAKAMATSIGVAEAAGDEVTVDLLIENIGQHEKMAWMLRSHLS